MNREQLQFIRSVLDYYFSAQHVDPELVVAVECKVDIVDFPRLLWCDCKRCTSTWVEKSTLGTTITITTALEDYYVYLPGDMQSFEHRW